MTTEVQLRITLLGDGGVGKTSLRRHYLGEGFTTSHLQTLGADFAVLRQVIGEYTHVYQIWDLAGQEGYQNIRSRYYIGSLGGVLIFDLTRRDSFDNIPNWINELWGHNGKGIIPIILVGNKSDLKEKVIKKDEAEKYAATLSEKTRQYGFEVKYLETSAKTGINVENAFQELGNIILKEII